MTDADIIEALEALLSRGLDLCARAQRLDQLFELKDDEKEGRLILTRSLSPALWLQMEYERDLETWENEVREHFRQHGRSKNVKTTLTTAETIRRETGMLDFNTQR